MLENYVVYKSPKDYPGKWVVRRWEIHTEPVCCECYVADTYEEAVNCIPLDLVKLMPCPGDDPCIVETWL